VTAFDASIGNAEGGPDEWRCKVRRRVDSADRSGTDRRPKWDWI
jgi:hypothetical protein